MSGCRGFKHPCGMPVKYRVSWSYDGARKYPSSYDLCGSCAEQAETFVGLLELRYHTDTGFSWVPITESAPDTPDHNTPPASQPPLS